MNESTINQLYRSTVLAFPKTTKRQHVTHEVTIRDLKYTPYIGVNTLLVRATAVNEDRSYKTLLLFKGMRYTNEASEDLAKITVNGRSHYFPQPTSARNDILVRCSCPDLYWRGIHYLKLDGSLYGRDRAKYEGQGLWRANPSERPIMCKHILKLIEELRAMELIAY